MPKNEDTKILIETATQLRIMNNRLFGGEGEHGALPFLFEQHKGMQDKVDTLKTELMDKIEETRQNLTNSIDTKKESIDEEIASVKKETEKVDKKVNWIIGIGTGAGAIVGYITNLLGGKH